MVWPVLWAAVRTYAPYLVFPAAATIGFIGYNLEDWFRDKYTPWRETAIERREKRRLEEMNKSEDLTQEESLKNKTFVPKSIFEKNVSPTLKRD